MKEDDKKSEKSQSEVEFNMAIEIDDMVFQKVMHWVNKSSFEVSGLGKVIIDKERNVFRIIDAVLIEQENSSSDTEMKAEAITKAMFQMKDTPGSLNWWWHSHCDMSVFWSGTDTDTIKELGTNGWFVSSVFNKRQEIKSAYVQNTPIRLFADDIPTTITRHIAQETIDEWDAQYENNVENVKSVVGNYYRSWPNWNEDDKDAKDAEEDFLTPEAMAAECDTDEDSLPSKVTGPEGDKYWEEYTKAEQEEFLKVEYSAEEEAGEDWSDEYTDRIAVLFRQHDEGEIDDEKLELLITELEKEYEFTNYDEEADAMDMSSISSADDHMS